MKSLLAESPILLSLLLGAIAVICVFGWLKTGARGALVAALVFFLLIPAGVALAHFWVTDREQVDATMHEIANHLANNDHEAVRAATHPNASPNVKQALDALPSFTFNKARITGVRSIEVWPERTPPEAKADFNVRVDLSGGGFQAEAPRRIIVVFWRQNGRWLVTDYEHLPVVGRADQYSESMF